MVGNNLGLPVLVLNASYEPLNVCNVRRAIGLVLDGKAELLLNGRGIIRTPQCHYPCPSVIRLDRMVKRPRREVKLNKWEVFRRDRYTCQYCGRRSRGLTIDHVNPRHRGGEHTWNNVVAACPACNRRKGGKTARAAHMTIQHLPVEPRPTATYLYGRYLDDNTEWRAFIDGW